MWLFVLITYKYTTINQVLSVYLRLFINRYEMEFSKARNYRLSIMFILHSKSHYTFNLNEGEYFKIVMIFFVDMQVRNTKAYVIWDCIKIEKMFKKYSFILNKNVSYGNIFSRKKHDISIHLSITLCKLISFQRSWSHVHFQIDLYRYWFLNN